MNLRKYLRSDYHVLLKIQWLLHVKYKLLFVTFHVKIQLLAIRKRYFSVMYKFLSILLNWCLKVHPTNIVHSLLASSMFQFLQDLSEFNFEDWQFIAFIKIHEPFIQSINFVLKMRMNIVEYYSRKFLRGNSKGVVWKTKDVLCSEKMHVLCVENETISVYVCVCASLVIP